MTLLTTKEGKYMIKQFIAYYKPYKKLFILDMLAALLFAVCDLVYPIITRNIMNEVVPNKDLRMLVVFAIALIGIFMLKAFHVKIIFKLLYAILGTCCWSKNAI